MIYTTIPSVKGQITIPAEIRNKYNIGKMTPMTVEDKGGGVITFKVMQMIDYSAIEFTKNKKGMKLTFKNGINPQVLIDAIKKIDGQDQ